LCIEKQQPGAVATGFPPAAGSGSDRGSPNSRAIVSTHLFTSRGGAKSAEEIFIGFRSEISELWKNLWKIYILFKPIIYTFYPVFHLFSLLRSLRLCARHFLLTKRANGYMRGSVKDV
jgi:hypothetical protein